MDILYGRKKTAQSMRSVGALMIRPVYEHRPLLFRFTSPADCCSFNLSPPAPQALFSFRQE